MRVLPVLIAPKKYIPPFELLEASADQKERTQLDDNSEATDIGLREFLATAIYHLDPVYYCIAKLFLTHFV